MNADEVRFCPRCGTPVVQALRFGRQRAVCPQCEWIYFADPKVAVALLVINEGDILLVQRSNEPYRGLWSLPAGFVDAGEDPIEAATRECLEETGLEVRVVGLVDLLYGQEHPRGAHILIVYRGEIISGTITAGDDAEDARFFGLRDLPPLAFKSTQSILQHWTSDKI
jgi:ADP-ribose pyrophosphatase YjhB (NUDIX family)